MRSPARMVSLIAPLLALALAGCPSARQARPSWLTLAPDDVLAGLADADPRAQRDLGLHSLLSTNEGDRGEELLEAAARRDGDDPLTWTALGVLRIEHGRNAEGLAALGRAVSAAVAARQRPDWCVSPGVTPAATPTDCRRLADVLEESAARWIVDTDVAGRRQVASELVERLGARLGLPSYYLLQRALEHDARVAGAGDRARERLRASGALLQWRLIGPFGPFANRSFDVAHAPEADERLADRYDLGPGRGPLDTWVPALSSSSVQLRSPLSEAGTWYAETFVTPSADGPADVRVWASANAPLTVWIGGVEVLRRDGRQRFEPSISSGRVELRAGQRVRVLVKIGSESSEPGFAMAMRDASGAPLRVDDGATGQIGRARAVEVDDLLELVAPAPTEDATALRAFVTSLLARARGHWPVAEEALSRVNDPSPLMIALRATASASTPTVPNAVQDDRLLSGMREALEGDPALWRARIVVARNLASENQGREAIDLLRQGLELHEQSAPLWHEIGVMARRMGLHSLARESFEHAVEADARSCGSLFQLMMMYQDASLTRPREQALARLVACDATTTARAELYDDAGRTEEALQEVLRLRGVVEFPSGLDDDIVELSLAAGRNDDARRLLDELMSRWPRARSYVSARADLAGAERGPAAAAERLMAAVERHPWEMGPLRRVAAVAGAERELESWRVDGLEHIRRFEQANVAYDAPSVYVLDRAVYRIYPDMSSVELVHQVTKVMTQEAVGAASEFRTPRGGEVLTLRTIKPDGTILEPLEYDEEETTNLPSVEVGDYVEWEYVIARGPSRIYPGGLQTPRFYFATSDTAMHRSELIVLPSEGVEVDFVPRGPSPPTGTPVELGGLRGMMFAADRVHSQVREPNMPSPSEVFSSIGTVAREDARSAVAAWSDGIPSALRVDWRIRDVVRHLREPGQTEVELARACYDWVLEHVQHGRGGTPATFTLASGHGDALLLFVAMLRAAGLEPEIVYAWNLAADRTGPYLAPGEMSATLVRVVLDDETWWLQVGSRHAPFGHLAATLRGQRGMVASGDPVEVVLPSTSRIDDLVETRIEGSLAADGTLDLELLERFVGARATELRAQVSRIPAAERPLRGAAMLGHQLAGAVAEDVRFDGVDDRHVPVEVHARLSSRMIVRREAGALLVPTRLSQATRYSGLARLSARRTPLVFDDELHEVVEQVLRLPAGARIELLCESVEETFGEARFSIRCAEEEGRLTQRLEIFLPPQRIAPADYQGFADFLRAYDEAASGETRIVVP